MVTPFPPPSWTHLRCFQGSNAVDRLGSPETLSSRQTPKTGSGKIFWYGLSRGFCVLLFFYEVHGGMKLWKLEYVYIYMEDIWKIYEMCTGCNNGMWRLGNRRSPKNVIILVVTGILRRGAYQPILMVQKANKVFDICKKMTVCKKKQCKHPKYRISEPSTNIIHFVWSLWV